MFDSVTGTFWTNPQFRTEVVDPDDDDDEDLGTLIVALMQIGRRRIRKEGHQFHTIGYSIYKVTNYTRWSISLTHWTLK